MSTRAGVVHPRCGKCAHGKHTYCEHPLYVGGFNDEQGRSCCCVVIVADADSEVYIVRKDVR